MATDINSLPDLCLENIFSYLSLKEKLGCTKVSLFWQSVLHRMFNGVKEVRITDSASGGWDDLPCHAVFGRNGIGFKNILHLFSNLQSLDISCNFDSDMPKWKIIRGLSHHSTPLLSLVKLRLEFDFIGRGEFFMMMNNVPNLKEFGGRFLQQFSGDQLQTLFTTCLKLETLDLSHNTKISSDDLQGCRAQLLSLNLSGCFNISSEALSHVLRSSKESLQRLDHSHSFPFTVRSFTLISGFTNLRFLRLPPSGQCLHSPTSPTHFTQLSGLTLLEEIDLHDGCVHDVDVSRIIHGCTHLRHVRLHFRPSSHLTSAGALSLCSLPHLQSLHLTACKAVLENQHLFALAQAPHLHELEIDLGLQQYEQNGFVTDEGLCAIGAMSALKNLKLAGFKSILSNQHLLSFSQLRNLVELDLGYCHLVNCSGLGSLARLSNSLKKLRVLLKIQLDQSWRDMEMVLDEFEKCGERTGGIDLGVRVGFSMTQHQHRAWMSDMKNRFAHRGFLQLSFI